MDCCPSRRSDKAWGVGIWALLVSPSNRSVHLCCPAEHEPATARLKIPFPQSWVSHVSPRRNRTSKDARKRTRETGAAASFQRTFDSPKKPLPFCCTREALESKHDLVTCHVQHQQQMRRGDRERKASFCLKEFTNAVYARNEHRGATVGLPMVPFETRMTAVS